MTDGEPDDDQDVNGLATRISQDTANKRYQFLPIGVGDANMIVLQKIGNGKAMMLQGTKFMSFFQWLSASMSTITSSQEGETIDISAGVDDWMKSFTI